MIFKKVDRGEVQIGKAEVDSDTNEEAITKALPRDNWDHAGSTG